MCKTRSVLLLAALALLPGFAKPSWDFGATAWTFQDVPFRCMGKAKGLGKVKAIFWSDGALTLNGDGSWVLSFNGEDIAGGDWTVDDEFDKSVELTLSPEGQALLWDDLEGKLEFLADSQGITVDVELSMPVIEKLQLFLKPNVKLQTARVKLVATVKATGLTDGNGLTDAPSTCREKLVWTSDDVPLADVLP